MKKKTRTLKIISLAITLVMLAYSIPFHAMAEVITEPAEIEETESETTGTEETALEMVSESYEFTDPELNDQGIPYNSLDATDTVNMGEPLEINSTTATITNGVYSFKNVGRPDFHMDTRHRNPEEGAYIQQYIYSSGGYQPPEVDFIRSGLFKISRRTDLGDNVYVMRSMLNNRLAPTPTIEGDKILVRNKSIEYINGELSQNDLKVKAEYTVRINYATVNGVSGYAISPYNDDVYMASCHATASGSAGGTNSYLQYVDTLDANALWTMTKYTGTYKWGMSLQRYTEWTDKGMIQNKAYPNSKIIGWCTTINYNSTFAELSSGYTDMASLTHTDTTGTISITPNYPGEINFRVGVKSSSSSTYVGYQTLSYRIVPAAGNYYMENVGTEKYMDISGYEACEGAEVIQWYYYAGDPQLVWTVEHVSSSGGYIRLKSSDGEYGSVYLGVNSSNTADTKIYDDINDYTLWKIDRTSRGTLKFTCKATEADGLALSVASSNDNAQIIQSTYTNNTDQMDEWNLYQVKYQSSISAFYDDGYMVRYNKTEAQAADEIEGYCLAVAERYMQLLGLAIVVQRVEHFDSAIDQCKGTTNSTNVHEYCGSQHSTEDAIITNFNEHMENYNTKGAYFTGHKILTDGGENRSFSNGNNVYILKVFNSESIQNKDIRLQAALMHELGHQFDAPDHYHPSYPLGAPCPNPDLCITCNPLTGRPTDCIMSGSGDKTITDDNILCDGCKNDMLSFLN